MKGELRPLHSEKGLKYWGKTGSTGAVYHRYINGIPLCRIRAHPAPLRSRHENVWESKKCQPCLKRFNERDEHQFGASMQGMYEYQLSKGGEFTVPEVTELLGVRASTLHTILKEHESLGMVTRYDDVYPIEFLITPPDWFTPSEGGD